MRVFLITLAVWFGLMLVQIMIYLLSDDLRLCRTRLRMSTLNLDSFVFGLYNLARPSIPCHCPNRVRICIPTQHEDPIYNPRYRRNGSDGFCGFRRQPLDS